MQTKKKTISIKELIILFGYWFVIFYDNISSILPGGNYFDESIAILAFIAMMLITMSRSKKNAIKKDTFFQLCSITIMIFLGVISNIAYGYVSNVSLIFRDAIGLLKFFITFYSLDFVFVQYNYSNKVVIKLAKFMISVIFLFGVISLFADVGMGNSVRFGIRSYQFVYGYYNILVFTEVLLIAVLMQDVNVNKIYYCMAFVSLAMTFRTKGVIMIAVALLFLFFDLKHKSPVLYGSITNKMKFIFPVIIVVFFLARNKITEYLSWGISNSIRIGTLATGFKIACNHFPLGSGFATYGTILSYDSRSPLYSIYDEMNYAVLMDPKYGFSTMSDTFWPAVYAQLGFGGLILYVYSLYLCYKKITHTKTASDRQKLSCVYILLYLILCTMSEATFINSTGVIAAMVMAFLLNGKECSSKLSKACARIVE